jgi:predicted dehydrogenase
MEDRVIRWGIIGAGGAARRFAEGLRDVSGATLCAVWSRRRETSASLVELFGGNISESLNELLASEIDAVYVGTLPDSHAAYSIAALQAGKHVLCEKPVTLDTEQLEQVIQTARTLGLLFMEAMKPPFYPLYKRLRAHLAGDPMGEVRFVRAGYATSNVPREHPSWQLETGGGSLMGIGVYQAFLAADWLGEAQQVQTLGRLSTRGVDAFAMFQTQHRDGFAQMYSGLDLSGPGDAVLVGADGHVTIAAPWWNPVRATVSYADGRVVLLDEPMSGSGFQYETAHFCGLIRLGQLESPVLPHALSLAVMRILDRARTAIR